MALSAFDDKSKEPQAADLQLTLGRSMAHWNALLTHLDAEFAPAERIWNFAGARWGWSLRVKRKKRTILYMMPCNKHFLVGFALGEKAVTAAHAQPLPEAILRVIEDAPRYAEGRGVRIEVRTKKDLAGVMKLAKVKMAN